MDKKFALDPNFLSKYREIKPSFGYNGLGEFVYARTYSRLKPTSSPSEPAAKEQWWETVKRVVEGTYQIQMEHINNQNLGWKDDQGQRSAQTMYDLIFNFKFLPPGRGLWAMGTDIITKKKLYAALNNCAFISTANIDTTFEEPFTFLMDLSMLGCGVGFDTEGAGKLTINEPNNDVDMYYTIKDSREEWVKSVKLLLESYFRAGKRVIDFDYDEIRLAGQPLKTFGGVSSGSDPLIRLHNQLRELLNKEIGKKISERLITDIMNLIGLAVVSGNVRRSAEMALGDANSDEFLNLKNLSVNPERKDFYWMSNNSVKAQIGSNYSKIVELIKQNGEPGICWLENMRKYSRMNGFVDNKDILAQGMNPCGEMTANSGTVCCLSEVFLNRHQSMKDFLRTLKFAYLYAKTVTLGIFHVPMANKVQLKERRIGLSLTGIAQFLSSHSLNELKKWCQTGYDEVQKWDKIYADWLAVPLSIKTTTVKPSGTISLLAGATPGIHFPESEYYIRRVRVEKTNSMCKRLADAGYKVEPDFYDPSCNVVEFPIWQMKDLPADKLIGKLSTIKDVSMWEQLHLCACLQEWWADNQVSATIKFTKEEGKHLETALNYFQYKLKSVSFLSAESAETGAYKQMPIEPISRDEYLKLTKNLKEVNYYTLVLDSEKRELLEDAQGDKYCTTDACLMKK